MAEMIEHGSSQWPRSRWLGRAVALGALLGLSCVTVQHVHVGVGAPDDGSWLHSEQSSAAVLTVRGLSFDLPGGQRSKTVTVSIDGRSVESCEVAETPSDVCVRDLRVEPGPHTLDVAIGCRDPATTRWLGCRYDLWERIVLAPREHVTFDVGQAIAHPDRPDRYLARRRAREIDAPLCIQALEALAYAPSCEPEQLAAATRIAQEARRVCTFGRLSGGHRTAARTLLGRALESHFSLPIARCYASRERGRPPNRIPTMMFSSTRTIDAPGGPWGWARSVLPRTVSDETSPEALLEHVRQGLHEMGPRLEAVTDLIAALLDPAKVADLRRRAMAGPWSFDWRHPNGLRHVWIVAARLHDEAYDEHLARAVAADASLHCTRHDAVELLLPYFLEGHRLTATEWAAVRAMLERTPPDARLSSRCTHVFNPNLVCEVPLEDRVRWFGRWDCSEARHPALRGLAFEAELRTGRPNDIPEDLAARMRQELGHCLAGPRPGR